MESIFILRPVRDAIGKDRNGMGTMGYMGPYWSRGLEQARGNKDTRGQVPGDSATEHPLRNWKTIRIRGARLTVFGKPTGDSAEVGIGIPPAVVLEFQRTGTQDMWDKIAKDLAGVIESVRQKLSTKEYPGQDRTGDELGTGFRNPGDIDWMAASVRSGSGIEGPLKESKWIIPH